MDHPYNLAIETAGHGGGVALGRGDDIIAVAELAGVGRQRDDLMAVVERLCEQHHVAPAQLAEVYLDLGPGSFTGLRLAVAVAKMLALSLDVKLVGVAGLDVLAVNVPSAFQHAAVGAAVKHGTLYSAVYQRTDASGGGTMRRTCAPALRSLDDLLALTPFPGPGAGALLVHKLPAGAEYAIPAGMTLLDPALAQGTPQAVHTLGRAASGRGDFADPVALAPIYAREPEAVTLWRKKSRGAV